MAAVGTKKPGGDVAVQLTFPAVFAEVYADSGEGESFKPSYPLAPARLSGGDDLQAAYHEQKRADAHHMVRAAVAASEESDRKMLVSHANYYGMPKPVLSQRRFANPSLGNQSGAIDSARRTMPGSTAPFRCVSIDDATGAGACGACYETQMRGGVLRTKEGQQWAASRLQDRVQQLNTIDAAAATPVPLETGEGIEYPNVADTFAPRAQLDLLAALDQLENALLGAEFGSVVRFAVTDFSTVIKLLVRFGTVASREEIEAAYAKIGSISQAVRGEAANRQGRLRLPPGRAGNLAGANDMTQAKIKADSDALNRSIYNRFQGLMTYLGMMLKGVTLQPRDRQTLSRTALRESGLLNFSPLTPAAQVAAQMAVVAQQAGPGQAGPGGPGPGGPGSSDEGDDEESSSSSSSSGIAKRMMARRRAAPKFIPDNRQRFGKSSGAFIGEAMPQEAGAAARNPFRRGEVAVPLKAPAPAPAPVFRRMAPPTGRAPADAAAAAERRSLVSDMMAQAPDIPLVEPVPRPMGRGKLLTRAMLPKDREGYVELAAKLRGMGHNIRVNSGSQLKSIRANFIKKLGL